ncbi:MULTISPECIES: hypothetical protein [unclassified Streptomyces]|uniref:hypothetical protein n=1 Tax=unclassified Streptomyces TaxID=2593676 RepID=UPI0018FEB6F3|nr:hypothetical protein [Streptomyces sp. CB01580]
MENDPADVAAAGRYPFFADNVAAMLRAGREHRHHAGIEQAVADSEASARAQLPSGHLHANAARLTLWPPGRQGLRRGPGPPEATAPRDPHPRPRPAPRDVGLLERRRLPRPVLHQTNSTINKPEETSPVA